MAHVDAAQEGIIASWRCLFPSPLHPVASAIQLVLHFPTPPSTSLPASWLPACSPLASTLCPSFPLGCTTFLYSMEGMLLPLAYQRNTFCESAISKSEVKKGYHELAVFKKCNKQKYGFVFCRHQVSRGYSTESARATLLRRGDASRGSSTERPCCGEVMLREDLRLSLPERPCCGEVMLREALGLSLPERPCCGEVMLFPSPLHPVASAIHLVLHFPTPPSTSLPALWLLACSPLASTLCPSLPRGCTTFLYSMEGMLLPPAYQSNTFCELAISKSEVKKGYRVVQKKRPPTQNTSPQLTRPLLPRHQC